MPLIASHQVVGACGISTLKKHVVIVVARNFQETRRSHSVTVVLDELQQLLSETLANPQLGAGKHFAVFLQDGPRDIQAGRFGDSKQQDSALQSCRFDGGRNQHIRVDYQTEGEHLSLRLPGPGSPDDLVNLARTHVARAVALSLLTKDS